MSPPPLPSRKRRTRLILAIVALILLPVLILLGWFVSFRVSNARAIARLEAKARLRGEPLTLSALAATYPPIDDEQNAAVPLLKLWQQEDPAYWQAFLQNQHRLPDRRPALLDPNLPILGPKSRTLSRTNSLPPAALAAAASYLEQQAEHLETVRAALRRPRFRFPIQLTDGFNALLPHLDVLKFEAQQFRLEALVATERDNIDAAINALTNTARCGQLLVAEPVLISQLIRLACFGMAFEGAQRLLSRRQLTEPQLSRLNILFHELQSTGSLRFVFVSERASALNVYNLSAADLASAANSEDDDGTTTEAGYAAGMKVLAALGLVGADQRLMLETFEEAIDLASQDSPEALRRCEALFQGVEAKSRRFPPRIFCGLQLPGLRKVPHRFASIEARRRAAVTALAVERHRLDHQGTLPDQLAQLVPQYLPAVPLDPIDGQPLRYRRLNPGYVIYSIGSDLIDHGGKERPTNGRDTGHDEGITVNR